jgi:hypothetical protein
VLIDWMRSRDPRSRALSISRKDRGAILPLGRAKQSVFWYATSMGEFTTSRYYADTLPTWIRRVNARRVPQSYAGQSWTLLLPAREYPEPDSVPQENAGREFLFPHVLSSEPARAASELPSTPWMDRLTLDAALEGLQALELGRGPQTDLLAISLSATDYVGHRYGPDSREQHDNVLRLDRALGYVHRLAVPPPRLEHDRLRPHGGSWLPRRFPSSPRNALVVQLRRDTTSARRCGRCAACCKAQVWIWTLWTSTALSSRSIVPRLLAHTSTPIDCSPGLPRICAGGPASPASTACETWCSGYGYVTP